MRRASALMNPNFLIFHSFVSVLHRLPAQHCRKRIAPSKFAVAAFAADSLKSKRSSIGSTGLQERLLTR